MGDFPQASQDSDRVFISTAGIESVGLDHYVTTNSGMLNTLQNWVTANDAIFVPFVVNSPFLAELLWCYNGTSAAGNADMAIVTPGGTRLVSIGSTARAGISQVQSFDIADTLLWPGVHYLGIALDGTSGTVACGLNSLPRGTRSVGLLKMASAFPIPATVTFASFSGTVVGAPLMGVSGRALV